jgi:signal transduction histidine kinase
MPLDAENPKINVNVFTENDWIKITVEDNGTGISKNTQAHIFEPKFTTKTSGMGLGLAMVKNIVETYNGSITFTSKSGEGTIFTVGFPKDQIPAHTRVS